MYVYGEINSFYLMLLSLDFQLELKTKNKNVVIYPR